MNSLKQILLILIGVLGLQLLIPDSISWSKMNPELPCVVKTQVDTIEEMFSFRRAIFLFNKGYCGEIIFSNGNVFYGEEQNYTIEVKESYEIDSSVGKSLLVNGNVANVIFDTRYIPTGECVFEIYNDVTFKNIVFITKGKAKLFCKKNGASVELDNVTINTDMDNDGYFDQNDDNCVWISNPDQKDSNDNNVGDICEKFYQIKTSVIKERHPLFLYGRFID